MAKNYLWDFTDNKIIKTLKILKTSTKIENIEDKQGSAANQPLVGALREKIGHFCCSSRYQEGKTGKITTEIKDANKKTRPRTKRVELSSSVTFWALRIAFCVLWSVNVICCVR